MISFSSILTQSTSSKSEPYSSTFSGLIPESTGEINSSKLVTISGSSMIGGISIIGVADVKIFGGV
jgi:hypothetical protein